MAVKELSLQEEARELAELMNRSRIKELILKLADHIDEVEARLKMMSRLENMDIGGTTNYKNEISELTRRMNIVERTLATHTGSGLDLEIDSALKRLGIIGARG